MKRIVSRKTLVEFWKKHADSEQSLKTWYYTAMNSEWNNPGDIKSSYKTASILEDNRVVFNIKGNSYRLVVKFNYDRQWGFIRFVGTHAEYNKINAATI
jgi:mRNA interferase HigB